MYWMNGMIRRAVRLKTNKHPVVWIRSLRRYRSCIGNRAEEVWTQYVPELNDRQDRD